MGAGLVHDLQGLGVVSVHPPEGSATRSLGVFIRPRPQQQLNRIGPLALDQSEADVGGLDGRHRPEPLKPEVVDEAVGLQRLQSLGDVLLLVRLDVPQRDGEVVAAEVAQFESGAFVAEVADEDAAKVSQLVDGNLQTFGCHVRDGHDLRSSAASEMRYSDVNVQLVVRSQKGHRRGHVAAGLAIRRGNTLPCGSQFLHKN